MEKLAECTYNFPWINLESPDEFRIVGEDVLELFIKQVKANWAQGREVIISAKQVRFIPKQ